MMFGEYTDEYRDYLEEKTRLLVEIQVKLNCSEEEIDFIEEHTVKEELNLDRIIFDLKTISESCDVGYNINMIKDLVMLVEESRKEV